jgi:putative ABC transport system substrate-binding protein
MSERSCSQAIQIQNENPFPHGSGRTGFSISMFLKFYLFAGIVLGIASCQRAAGRIPVVGFADAFQDATIARAKDGFFDALSDSGFSTGKGTLKVIYRNAQGDIPVLTQAMQYFISAKVNLIAANATVTTIAAVQQTRSIPVCMMVAPEPRLAGLCDKNGMAPSNLFGVFETLSYMDTSVKLIRELMPDVKVIGTIFNQAEPQSREALHEIGRECSLLHLTLIALPVNSSAETQLVVSALLSKHIDVFFAMPDNTIFASFETIARSCGASHVPIFSSEAGLVSRGAIAAYGADMYGWGFQAGQQAARYLRQGNMKDLRPVEVILRKRVYNPAEASVYHLHFDTSFTAVLPAPQAPR